jgi:hypothetical protein
MRGRLTLVAATTVLMTVAATSTASAQERELKFVAPDQIALTGSDGSSDKVSVWVENASNKQVTPNFAAILEDGDGNAVSRGTVQVVAVNNDDNEIAIRRLAANQVSRYRLFLKGSGADEDGSGQLVATGSGIAPASVSLAVGPESIASNGVDFALLFPLGGAVLLILIASLTVVRPVPLRDPLGTLDLDFATSFASTLTAVGALLGTIIAAGVLPDDTVNLSKEAFTALNLLFGAAIVVAGVVYAAVQKAIWVDSETDALKQERKLQGYVGSFLISCLITTWAVFGELWVSWLLVDELGQGQGVTGFGVVVFKILLIAAAIAMVFYTLWRIQSTVKSERDKPAPGAAPGAFGPAAPARLKRISLL